MGVLFVLGVCVCEGEGGADKWIFDNALLSTEFCRLHHLFRNKGNLDQQLVVQHMSGSSQCSN